MQPRGRPRNFDRDVALRAAMEVFWARGYEASQVSDLIAAMAINPPSFYAAFQSKEAVYREAVDLYLSTVGAASMRALQTRPDVISAFEAMLAAAIDLALCSASSGGCLVSLGLINAQPQNSALRDHMRDLRRTTVMLIRDRLMAGILDGELPPDLDLDPMARFFATVLHGLSLQAQDGASAIELAGIAAVAVSTLPLNSNPCPAPRTDPVLP